jgi:hypothetical protein
VPDISKARDYFGYHPSRSLGRIIDSVMTSLKLGTEAFDQMPVTSRLYGTNH